MAVICLYVNDIDKTVIHKNMFTDYLFDNQIDYKFEKKSLRVCA